LIERLEEPPSPNERLRKTMAAYFDAVETAE
jgi:uncharacterized protein (DUF1778 family)